MAKHWHNFERIKLLFEVREKAAAHGTTYSSIVAAADAELRSATEEPQAAAAEPPKEEVRRL